MSQKEDIQKTILIVEDCHHTTHLYETALGNGPFKFRIFDCSLDALRWLQTYRYFTVMIITDAYMPLLNGDEFLEYACDLYDVGTKPKTVVAQNSTDSARYRYADAKLYKPFTRAKLRMDLQDLLHIYW